MKSVSFPVPTSAIQEHVRDGELIESEMSSYAVQTSHLTSYFWSLLDVCDVKDDPNCSLSHALRLE